MEVEVETFQKQSGSVGSHWNTETVDLQFLEKEEKFLAVACGEFETL